MYYCDTLYYTYTHTCTSIHLHTQRERKREIEREKERERVRELYHWSNSSTESTSTLDKIFGVMQRPAFSTRLFPAIISIHICQLRSRRRVEKNHPITSFIVLPFHASHSLHIHHRPGRYWQKCSSWTVLLRNNARSIPFSVFYGSEVSRQLIFYSTPERESRIA